MRNFWEYLVAGLTLFSLAQPGCSSLEKKVEQTRLTKTADREELACFLGDNIVFSANDGGFGNPYSFYSIPRNAREVENPRKVLDLGKCSEAGECPDFYNIHKISSGLKDKAIVFSGSYGKNYGIFAVSPDNGKLRKIFQAIQEDENGEYRWDYVVSEDSKYAIARRKFGKTTIWYKFDLGRYNETVDVSPSGEEISLAERQMGGKMRKGVLDERDKDRIIGGLYDKDGQYDLSLEHEK